MSFLRNLGAVIGIQVGGSARTALPKWPHIPRSGAARVGFETVLLTMFSGIGVLVRSKGLAVKEALPLVKEVATQALRYGPDDELLAVNVFTKAHHGQGNLQKAFERFEAYSVGSSKLRRAAFETFLYVDSALPGANAEVEDFLSFMAEALELTTELESIRTAQKAEIAAQKIAEEQRNQAAVEGVKRLRTKVKEVTASVLDRSYLTLESAPEDPFEDIEGRYRKLVFEYHPDLAKGRGESQEAIEEKRSRYQAILKAYSTIKRSRSKKQVRTP